MISTLQEFLCNLTEVFHKTVYALCPWRIIKYQSSEIHFSCSFFELMQNETMLGFVHRIGLVQKSVMESRELFHQMFLQPHANVCP